MYIYTYITLTYINIHTYIHTYMHTYIHTNNIHTYIHTYIHIYIYLYNTLILYTYILIIPSRFKFRSKVPKEMTMSAHVECVQFSIS